MKEISESSNENYADAMVQVTDEYLSPIPNDLLIKIDLY
jgi:hypothetical protein